MSQPIARMNLIVLAGGQSRRMGSSKYCISLAGVPLYEYPLRLLGDLYDRQIIVENKGLVHVDDRQRWLIAHDIVEDAGPLGGIYSGLSASDALLNMVVGADMPFVCPQLAQAMSDRARAQNLDVLAPDIDGFLEPLFAIYSHRVTVVAADLLASGIRGVRALFQSESLRVGFVDRVYCEYYDKRLLSFFNVNTPDDLRRAEQIMQVEEKSRGEESVCR